MRDPEGRGLSPALTSRGETGFSPWSHSARRQLHPAEIACRLPLAL